MKLRQMEDGVVIAGSKDELLALADAIRAKAMIDGGNLHVQYWHEGKCVQFGLITDPSNAVPYSERACER